MHLSSSHFMLGGHENCRFNLRDRAHSILLHDFSISGVTFVRGLVREGLDVCREAILLKSHIAASNSNNSLLASVGKIKAPFS